jgi:hypothetical protein
MSLNKGFWEHRGHTAACRNEAGRTLLHVGMRLGEHCCMYWRMIQTSQNDGTDSLLGVVCVTDIPLERLYLHFGGDNLKDNTSLSKCFPPIASESTIYIMLSRGGELMRRITWVLGCLKVLNCQRTSLRVGFVSMLMVAEKQSLKRIPKND